MASDDTITGNIEFRNGDDTIFDCRGGDEPIREWGWVAESDVILECCLVVSVGHIKTWQRLLRDRRRCTSVLDPNGPPLPFIVTASSRDHKSWGRV